MEHRWHHRKPLNHSVIIYRQGCAIAICAVKNISLGGIALQSGPLGFPRNTPVEIELQLDHALHMRRHHLPAWPFFTIAVTTASTDQPRCAAITCPPVSSITATGPRGWRSRRCQTAPGRRCAGWWPRVQIALYPRQPRQCSCWAPEPTRRQPGDSARLADPWEGSRRSRAFP